MTAAGDLLIGGTVSLVGGQQTRHVALWDGRAWSPIGNSLPLTRNWSSVVGLLQLANGDIVVAGAPGETLQWFYRWTGTGWVVPPGTPPTVVGPIAAATVGSGAMFSMSVPSAMLYFDGTTWSVLPPDGERSASSNCPMAMCFRARRRSGPVESHACATASGRGSA